MATTDIEVLDDPQEMATPTQEDSTAFENPGAIMQASAQFNDIFGDVCGGSDLQQSLSIKPDVLQQVSAVFPTPTLFEDGEDCYYQSNEEIYKPVSPTPTLAPTPLKFTDLPPEMRNAVYDLLGHSTPDHSSCKTTEEKRQTAIASEVADSHGGDGVRLSASNSPVINVLLVSKQFNAEYTARMKMQASWIFTDTYQPIPLSVALGADIVPPQIKTAHFRLLSSCNYCQNSVSHGRTPEHVLTFAQARAQAQAAAAGNLGLPTATEDDLEECEIQREIGEHLTYIHSSLSNNFQHVKQYTIQLVLFDMPEKCTWPVNAGNKHIMSALNTIVSNAEFDAHYRDLRGVEIVLAKRKTPGVRLAHGLDDLKDCVTHGRWTKRDGWQEVEPPKTEVLGGAGVDKTKAEEAGTVETDTLEQSV